MGKAKAPTKKKAGKSSSLISKILKIFKWTLIIFFGSTIFMVLLYKWVNPPITPLMVIRKIEGYSINKDWESLDKMSPNLPLAALAAEDPNFLTHRGFDFNAIEKAYKENNKKNARRVRGGSTISQQTAKNVFLWPTRDYIRKGLETYFTILIEFIWGKERIMEVYLNVVETGPGIYGCEAGSKEYFHKLSAKLNQQEAASIICLFPNPRKYKINTSSPKMLEHRRNVVQGMNYIGKVNF